jgi:hypothetical protein
MVFDKHLILEVVYFKKLIVHQMVKIHFVQNNHPLIWNVLEAIELKGTGLRPTPHFNFCDEIIITFLFPFEYYDIRFGEEYTKKKRKTGSVESCLLEGKLFCFLNYRSIRSLSLINTSFINVVHLIKSDYCSSLPSPNLLHMFSQRIKC